MEEDLEEGAPQIPLTRGRHIKKKALKNKALSVSFNEKDLRDYVTGFHKRKKKRRKEAEKKQEEALRRKRIEERKKRKLEREFALYGGAPPASGSTSDENDGDLGEDEEGEPVPLVAGTTMYDNGEIKVTVTTREISREVENFTSERTDKTGPRPVGASANKKQTIPVNKSKSFKKVRKLKSQGKSHKRRDRKKGKVMNNKSR